jgi:hypothetical protein
LEKSICTKCALSPKFTYAEKKKYYKKYSGNYELEKLPELVDDEYIRAEDPAVPSHIVDWKYDFSKISEAAKLVKVSPNIIESFGRMENRTWSDVIENISPPAFPEFKISPSIYYVDTEIRLILISLSKLKNKITDVKYSSGDLKALTPIGADYAIKFMQITQSRDAKDIYLFTLEYLCSMILDIYAISTAMQAEATKLLNNTIYNQKMFTRPGKFNWSIFYEDEADVYELENDFIEAEPEGDALFDANEVDHDFSHHNPNNDY